MGEERLKAVIAEAVSQTQKAMTEVYEKAMRDMTDEMARIAKDRIQSVEAERDRLAAELSGVRDGALEEAAKVADKHATDAWEIGKREGENDVCSSGRNYGARYIATAIRALKGEPRHG